MKSGRQLKFLGDAPPGPELDARLEEMEARAEADLAAGRVGFKWTDEPQHDPAAPLLPARCP
ncbi:MAG TPA: hypothetical protein VIR57_03235 [Chloroflexota bacterium]|jgi:hypothetical protein